ncbi:hypothetical protein [Oceanobacillus senegalensis]|uniref:hypothetical protein n=1 Tax=Oceanobacillus senegalensis TaxID=1936063 RepID=UPI000A313685|nr:hypothetical protein [Oceanobacillus senegalensis]
MENDQANELRNLFEEIIKEESAPENMHIEKEEPDVLNLPPRKEIHKSSNRTQIKVKKPFMRFLFVTLVLFTIILVTYYYVGDTIVQW